MILPLHILQRYPTSSLKEKISVDELTKRPISEGRLHQSRTGCLEDWKTRSLDCLHRQRDYRILEYWRRQRDLHSSDQDWRTWGDLLLPHQAKQSVLPSFRRESADLGHFKLTKPNTAANITVWIEDHLFGLGFWHAHTQRNFVLEFQIILKHSCVFASQKSTQVLQKQSFSGQSIPSKNSEIGFGSDWQHFISGRLQIR